MATLVALSLSLTACSASDSSMSSISSDAGTSQMGMDAVEPAIGTVSPDQMTKTDSSSVTLERATIETAWMSVTVTAPKASASTATDIATSAGGFIQDSSWNPASQYGPEIAYLTLRVPSDQLDAVVDSLSALGTVDSLSRSSSDVTMTLTDLNARIASLTASLDSLRALQSQATNVTDLIAAESAIAQRQAELDSLVAQQTYLADQVDLSTVGLTLTGRAGGTPTNQTFWDGLVAGWNSLGVVGAGLLVALGFALPWIVLVVVFAGIVTGIVMTLVRRRHSKATKKKKK